MFEKTKRGWAKQDFKDCASGNSLPGTRIALEDIARRNFLGKGKVFKVFEGMYEIYGKCVESKEKLKTF